jgi:hypothetical protein
MTGEVRSVGVHHDTGRTGRKRTWRPQSGDDQVTTWAADTLQIGVAAAALMLCPFA